VKVTLGFLVGILFSGLLLFGIQAALPIRAQTEDFPGASENFSLVQLLPDIEKIYREALITPLKQAEAKIYDRDIAEFYHKLLDKSVLSGLEEEAAP